MCGKAIFCCVLSRGIVLTHLYTKSENHFLRKSNLKLLGWKMSVLSIEWKCVKVVPNNMSKFWTNLSNLECVTVKYIWRCPWKICTFLINPRKSVVISCQMDFRMLISNKNQFRTIMYSPINVHTGVNFFFFKCSSDTFTFNFLKMSFFRFQTLKCYNLP